MVRLKEISIRGRVAYLICCFEKLLMFYEEDLGQWKSILEKLWRFTSIEYIDDWMYELAEYIPNSILNDDEEGAEYITPIEFQELYALYKKTNSHILSFLNLIYECGSIDIYSGLRDYSPNTLGKVNEAIDILDIVGVEKVDIQPFRKFSYYQDNGWGNCFVKADI